MLPIGVVEYAIIATSATTRLGMLTLLSHLDFLAAGLTGTSTVLLAMKRRTGFLILAAGAGAWAGVALLATYSGRHVWGMVLSSAWTFSWACWGWHKWR